MQKHLQTLFESWSGEALVECEMLPVTASDRRYFRLMSQNKSCMGVYNPDKKENDAFIDYSLQFHKAGLPVPEIYAISDDGLFYLQQDLGLTSLFDHILTWQDRPDFSEKIRPYYEKAIDNLLRFQIEAGANFNYKKAYPRDAFDKQSMLWDLNYFKYYFLKLGRIHFDEDRLESDFHILSEYLCNTPSQFFLYRDFQSRNIMVHNEELYFIDYQGGRRGALPYDLASLLYDAKANLPRPLREQLLHYYIERLRTNGDMDISDFQQRFYAFVFIRIFQAMGSYGFRGFYEKKAHFLKSIPYAIDNLECLYRNHRLPLELPEIGAILEQLFVHPSLRPSQNKASSLLHIDINSFSFRQGYPPEPQGHGGGFVFDCRFLPNPGREAAYKDLCGLDAPVIKYLENFESVRLFVQQCASMVSAAIENYNERKFEHLQINFGCTGGQHRSVFCAEHLAEILRHQFDNHIVVKHIEQAKKN